jgi:hypothetical protein
MKLKVFLFGLIALGLFGCIDNTTDSRQKIKTEKMVRKADRVIGIPKIKNFTERRFAKQILELRDSEIATYTYIADERGNIHLLCKSIGYGLPYAVQYTNPQRYEMNGATLPQPDPNGLFMPNTTEATWVLCSDGKGGVRPVYSEPRLVVSPFPLTLQN